MTKNYFFLLIDFNENWHVDAHYRIDEGYYIKHGFLPPGGTATCFFGVLATFSTLFTITFINGPFDDLVTTKAIDQMYTFREPNCAHYTIKMVLLWFL